MFPLSTFLMSSHGKLFLLLSVYKVTHIQARGWSQRPSSIVTGAKQYGAVVSTVTVNGGTVSDSWKLLLFTRGGGWGHVWKRAFPLKLGHFWLWMNILVKLRSICLSENTPVYSNTTLRCKQFRHNTVIFSDTWFFPSKIIIIVIVIIIMTGEALFSLYLIVQ